ncbi:MAG: MerR family transcriptional regulator, partial [Clostridiales bacterium]|nr:MerR family transcriptional regulator [Clostridiales bacterium]
MNDVRYMISEAAKLVDVEQHTLRYWEDELELEIPRNEMGHRYYRDKDISILKAVKAFKDKGYQLRAIKMLIPEIQKNDDYTYDNIEELQNTYEDKSIVEESESDIFVPMTTNSDSTKKEVEHTGNEENSS